MADVTREDLAFAVDRIRLSIGKDRDFQTIARWLDERARDVIVEAVALRRQQLGHIPIGTCDVLCVQADVLETAADIFRGRGRPT
jgi:hypothetical protein